MRAPPGRSLVAIFIATTLGGVTASPSRPLLKLRGGAQPLQVEARISAADAPQTLDDEAGAADDGAAALRKVLRNKSSTSKAKKKNARAAFDLQDAATIAICLASAGAAGIGSQPLMAMVPRGLKDIAWIGFGGILCTMLFLIVWTFDHGRGVSVSRALSKVLVGGDGSSPVQAFAFVAALGCLASVQSLPSAAGWQRKQLIKMGRAIAYDFNVMMPTLCIMGAALAAACKFSDKPAPSGGPKSPAAAAVMGGWCG